MSKFVKYLLRFLDIGTVTNLSSSCIDLTCMDTGKFVFNLILSVLFIAEWLPVLIMTS